MCWPGLRGSNRNRSRNLNRSLSKALQRTGLYKNTVLIPASPIPDGFESSAALPLGAAAGQPPPQLLNQLRDRLRYPHCSIRTEEAYVHWVRAFVRIHSLRHPASMAAVEV